MAAIRGSSLPITITVSGVNLTSATEITFAVALQQGRSPTSPGLTKKKSTGDITVAYDAGTGASTLTLTLSDTETASYTQHVYYALYIEDGSTGGAWIPDNGGTGVIAFTNSVKKS